MHTAPPTVTAPASTSAAASPGCTRRPSPPTGRGAPRRGPWGRPRRTSRRRCGPNTATTPRAMAPTTMPASATLNTGHHWKSMKSTTAALRGSRCGSGTARSHRLPRRHPGPGPRRRCRAACAASGSSGRAPPRRSLPAARWPGPRPRPDRRLKAAPVLCASAKLERPRDVDGAGVAGCRSAHDLVSWSTITTTAAMSATVSRTDERRGCGSPARRATGQRRVNPPVLYSTRSRAHGIASRRSSGILSPDISQMP